MVLHYQTIGSWMFGGRFERFWWMTSFQKDSKGSFALATRTPMTSTRVPRSCSPLQPSRKCFFTRSTQVCWLSAAFFSFLAISYWKGLTPSSLRFHFECNSLELEACALAQRNKPSSEQRRPAGWGAFIQPNSCQDEYLISSNRSASALHGLVASDNSETPKKSEKEQHIVKDLWVSLTNWKNPHPHHPKKSKKQLRNIKKLSRQLFLPRHEDQL